MNVRLCKFLTCCVPWMQPWDSYKPAFIPPAAGRLADALVPSADTVRTAWLLQCALASDRPCLFSGESGIGKTVTILEFLRSQRQMAAVVGINFSSRTTSADVQRLVEVGILSPSMQILQVMETTTPGKTN